MHEYVVGSDANLARIEKLSKGSLRRCELNLGIVVHNHGTFPTKLKDAGSQVLGSRLSNNFANLR